MARRLLLEIAVDRMEDAVAAAEHGADRLELCAHLDQDGLTPPAERVRAVLERTGIPVFVLVRPHARGFACDRTDLESMAASIAAMRALGVAGLVFGAARADGMPDAAACRRLLEACGGLPAVYHRAFDLAPDAPAALDLLRGLGFRRVLTSGGAGPAPAGAARIAALLRHAGGGIEILPGGGVRAGNAAALLRATGCDQVHSSARRGGRFAAEEAAALRAALDAALPA